MEYTKDVRTDNLTLRDIHVGDWVQVWSETTERYSPPLKIIQICDDGTIYLVTSDEERPTPWEENIKNVDALPITPELLKGFGFEVIDNITKYLVYYNKIEIGYIQVGYSILYIHSVGIYTGYVHRLFDMLIRRKVLENVNFEWKGLNTTQI